MKALIVILLVCSILLGIAWMKRHNQAVQEKQEDLAVITELSNRVEETRSSLDEQQTVNAHLKQDLKKTQLQLTNKVNEATRLTTELAEAQAQSKANAEAYQAAQAENAKRQTKIDALSQQIDTQTQQLTDLNSAIKGLNDQIASTETKLAASEGDREFLLKELKRMQTEKADLERQFNDLAMLRSQISKLREELSIAKRIEWIRSGLYGSAERKGAEQLLLGNTPPPTRPGFDLNVEIRQDGAATVNTNKPGSN
jgi:chromosome segregation ATPase